MKTSIRPQSFETNSSSQHAIVFSKDYDISKASEIHSVYGGEFGWEYETYTEPEEKLSYLWTAIKNNSNKDPLFVSAWKEYLSQELNLSPDVSFQDLLVYESWDYYIDHSTYVQPLLDAMLKDPEVLRAFVYGEGYIETGNDNDGWPEGHMMESVEWTGCWDDENNEWIDSQVEWEALTEWDGKWLYLKGN